jgi:hypothetical protein
MDGHDSDVMAGDPDGCQKITPIGAPGFRGGRKCAKTGILAKTPKFGQKWQNWQKWQKRAFSGKPQK